MPIAGCRLPIFRFQANRQALFASGLLSVAGFGVRNEWGMWRPTALQVAGRERIAPTGGTLILSNHPGLSDTVALFAATARTDLRVIALDRPFLRALPNTANRLFMLPDDTPGRMAVMRAAAGRSRRRGAVNTGHCARKHALAI